MRVDKGKHCSNAHVGIFGARRVNAHPGVQFSV